MPYERSEHTPPLAQPLTKQSRMEGRLRSNQTKSTIMYRILQVIWKDSEATARDAAEFMAVMGEPHEIHAIRPRFTELAPPRGKTRGLNIIEPCGRRYDPMTGIKITSWRLRDEKAALVVRMLGGDKEAMRLLFGTDFLP